jgi:signal transduction histidine kinase/DNA-binding response OmpR family regulator
MLTSLRCGIHQKLILSALLTSVIALVLAFAVFASATVITTRAAASAKMDAVAAVLMTGLPSGVRIVEAQQDATGFWTLQLRRAYPAVGERPLVLETDLSPMWTGLVDLLLICAGLTLAALAAAVLIAARLHRSITTPLAELNRAARQFCASEDYSLRIAHQRRDELGDLIDSFNTMLDHAQQRSTALALHRSDLERQVGTRTQQLEKAKNAAEAASRAKSGFLATISHEIRTPMNGVLGMADMLLATPLEESQRRYATMLRRSGEHLMVIINDILDFSKIEAGKLTVDYIPFNLADLLDEVDHIFAAQASAKGLDLHLDIHPGLPIALQGDPNRLRQVLANLLGNAIKFTDRGAISLHVRLEHEDSQCARLRFTVEDTGIGVSHEARERIFEAFSQADSSTTRKYGGTGLGLAIARELVELMAGEIGIEPARLDGSAFWFTVVADKQRDDALPGLDAKRILLVDPDPIRREQIKGVLAIAGADVEPVDGAEDALRAIGRAAAAETPFHAVVVEMNLHHTSGIALCATLRRKATRLVLLTDVSAAADRRQCQQAGVSCQLAAPIRPADLLLALVCPTHTAIAKAPVAAPVAPELTSASRPCVLLAEDNPVNVEVAGAMLASLGLDVLHAANGEQACNIALTRKVDVILMDCQMPVMDGFAATAELRRHSHLGKLPIIAVTANALQGDRDSCLAAGMDDYLSKPFAVQELAAVVGRWLALPRGDAAAPEAVRQADDPISHQALDNIRALSSERGSALVRKVVSAYVDDAPLQLNTLRLAIAGQDPAELRRVAHSLKSASANVGALALAQMCKQMEHLGRAEQIDGASGILTDIEQEFHAVRRSLHVILDKEA